MVSTRRVVHNASIVPGAASEEARGRQEPTRASRQKAVRQPSDGRCELLERPTQRRGRREVHADGTDRIGTGRVLGPVVDEHHRARLDAEAAHERVLLAEAVRMRDGIGGDPDVTTEAEALEIAGSLERTAREIMARREAFTLSQASR